MRMMEYANYKKYKKQISMRSETAFIFRFFESERESKM